MPPVPAAVMMCESANDVTEMSDRVPVGVPRSVEPERVAGVLDDLAGRARRRSRGCDPSRGRSR